MLQPALVTADDTVSREYKIKAAYLYNLIKFIHWPSNSAVSTTDGEAEKDVADPTNICVYGDNPFGGVLDKLTSRKAKGRAIEITYLTPEQKVDSCEVIFIAKSNKVDSAFLNQAGSQNQLTVGENINFLEQGGLISLVVADNNVQLQINLTQAKEYGFQISGNLLEIAKTVR